MLKVYVSAPPIDDQANKAVIEEIAKYAHVPISQVEITKGLKSRNKMIIIYD